MFKSYVWLRLAALCSWHCHPSASRAIARIFSRRERGEAQRNTKRKDRPSILSLRPAPLRGAFCFWERREWGRGMFGKGMGRRVCHIIPLTNMALRACFEIISGGLAAGRGGWLCCSSVEEPRGIFSFVAPRHPPRRARNPCPDLFSKHALTKRRGALGLCLAINHLAGACMMGYFLERDS
jgi:hypothetical protein